MADEPDGRPAWADATEVLLRARIAELEELLAAAMRQCDDLAAVESRVRDLEGRAGRARELEAENAALREALKPFAAEASGRSWIADSVTAGWNVGGTNLTNADLRRAMEAYLSSGAGHAGDGGTTP